MIALLLAAALSCVSAEGWTLTLGSRLEPQSDDVLKACRAMARCGGWRYVADRPGTWFIVAWECGTDPVAWPAGRNLSIVTEKADTLEATDLLAMTPPTEQRVILLGKRWVLLNPGELWQPRRGTPKLYARFPRLTGRPVSIILTEGR